MSENLSNSVVGGTISGIPVTTAVTEQVSPSLLRNEIDNRIVKVRPCSTPLDQISRMIGARHAGSMKVDYYSVDTKPTSTRLLNTIEGCELAEGESFEAKIAHGVLLSESETVMFPSVKMADGSPLVCYVKSAAGQSVQLIPANLPRNEKGIVSIPEIEEETLVVRMGRAAGELDVQTPQFAALPRKASNYCQIFKAQVEESMLQRLSDKEVGWTFSDQEEVAVIDMRLGMEKSFLFGACTRLDIGEGKEVMLTGGIWSQAGRDFTYSPDRFDNTTVINMMRMAFTLGAGSSRKVLIGGSGLIERLNLLDISRVAGAADKTTVWGVDFHCMVSKFGTLYVVLSEIFDLCGKEDCGIVIDPEYITKYSHIPFRADRISFRQQGVRNTEAVVLTEASCLVLRYPDAHMRITTSA